MIKRFVRGIVSATLLVVGIFFAVIVAYLTSTEVMPALKQGSLDVTTSTMILNHVWEGNEIYVILGVYTVLACVLVWLAIRIGISAVRG
jgi:uncharacterized membrane protein required for colicin V production